MIKLFAADLDGTLLKRGNIIQEEDIKAIHTLNDQGIDFAIATGRMERDIKMVCKEINQPAHRISDNGAFVHTKQNANLLSATFDKETSKQIHELIKKTFPNPYSITTQHEAYISVMTPELEKLEEVLYFPLIEGVDFMEAPEPHSLPSKFMMLGESHLLLPFQQEVNTAFGDKCETYISDTHSLDIVPKGVSKAAGLKVLARDLNMEPEEMAVIGDSFNDIPMFQMTANSFAMRTAPEEVKREAAYVVDEVHEAIEQISDLLKN